MHIVLTIYGIKTARHGVSVIASNSYLHLFFVLFRIVDGLSKLGLGYRELCSNKSRILNKLEDKVD